MSLTDTVKLRGYEIAKLSQKIHRQRLTINRLKEYNRLLEAKLALIEATDRVVMSNNAIAQIATRSVKRERVEELVGSPV